MNACRKLLRAKIHRATITHADLHYEGSLTIPPVLMEAADIKDLEAVHVWNITNGERLETYAITGAPDNSNICANGAAAHKIRPGDLVIIACFSYLSESEISKHKPKLIFVDKNNQIKDIRPEVPGPLLP